MPTPDIPITLTVDELRMVISDAFEDGCAEFVLHGQYDQSFVEEYVENQLVLWLTILMEKRGRGS